MQYWRDDVMTRTDVQSSELSCTNGKRRNMDGETRNKIREVCDVVWITT